ncbi:unnamed protein product, partial [Durusdinium trenchii]
DFAYDFVEDQTSPRLRQKEHEAPATFSTCSKNLRQNTLENLDSFLTSLTAAADYDTFLKVMLNEMIRQQEAGILAAAPGSQQIQVTVPEGLSIDADYRRGYPPTMQTMPVEYQGYTYQVPIPSGYGPGASFNVTVAMPCPS